jgi:phospholipase/carboxylesterase
MKVLIWLHGLGSSPEEFEDFFFDYNLIDSNYKIYLLQAPKVPVSINNGYTMRSWFDITKMDSEEFSYNF